MRTALGEFAPPIVEALMMFNALRSLGHAAEDIWFAPDGGAASDELFLVLKRPHGDFYLTVGKRPPWVTPEEAVREWEEMATALQFIHKSELDAAWDASWIKANAAGLVEALITRGFLHEGKPV